MSLCCLARSCLPGVGGPGPVGIGLLLDLQLGFSAVSTWGSTDPDEASLQGGGPSPSTGLAGALYMLRIHAASLSSLSRCSWNREPTNAFNVLDCKELLTQLNSSGS